MTVKELLKTLENRMSGLSYRLWKQANLISSAFSKSFPKTHEKASPELDIRVKPTIKMPTFLKDEYIKQLGGR